MSMASPEQAKGFENRIEEQLEAMDLSPEGLENVQSLETGRVSEVLGKAAGENIPKGKQTKQTGLKLISQQVAGLLAGGGMAHPKTLPLPPVQKRRVKRVIEKRTKKLVRQAMRMQNSKNFSAPHLEEILLEIRSLRKILASMIQITADRVEILYRRYVLKGK